MFRHVNLIMKVDRENQLLQFLVKDKSDHISRYIKVVVIAGVLPYTKDLFKEEVKRLWLLLAKLKRLEIIK